MAQQVPGDHDDGPADREDGLALTANAGDALVAFAEEGLSAGLRRWRPGREREPGKG